MHRLMYVSSLMHFMYFVIHFKTMGEPFDMWLGNVWLSPLLYGYPHLCHPPLCCASGTTSSTARVWARTSWPSQTPRRTASCSPRGTSAHRASWCTTLLAARVPQRPRLPPCDQIQDNGNHNDLGRRDVRPRDSTRTCLSAHPLTS